MTYAEAGYSTRWINLIPGRSGDRLNRIFGSLKKPGHAGLSDLQGVDATSEMSPLEQRLTDFQTAISHTSMYLPSGFASGLNRQFANMLDEDSWEEEDELPTHSALETFLEVLRRTRTKRRPGIGSNGRGSITAFWSANTSRLTIECLPSGLVSWVLTRSYPDSRIERAGADCMPDRLMEVLAPYAPEVWFDQPG